MDSAVSDSDCQKRIFPFCFVIYLRSAALRENSEFFSAWNSFGAREIMRGSRIFPILSFVTSGWMLLRCGDDGKRFVWSV